MMNIELGGLLFGICLVLIALRMPVAVAMFAVGGFGFATLAGWPAFLNLLNTVPFGRVSNYTLSVLPLFLLMGQFATRAGLSRSLFDAARAWVGHRRGGLAIATIFGCGAFGSICGSSLATGATMASVALPEMKRHGYSGALATGTLAAGGTLGILIPPSVILVIYAIITEQSIGKLFLAALDPGSNRNARLLRCNRSPGPAQPRVGAGSLPAVPFVAGNVCAASAAVWPVAVIFVSVIGGIHFGVFTPDRGRGDRGGGDRTAVALASGRLSWAAFTSSLLETAQATAMIFLILIGAEISTTGSSRCRRSRPRWPMRSRRRDWGRCRSSSASCSCTWSSAA